MLAADRHRVGPGDDAAAGDRAHAGVGEAAGERHPLLGEGVEVRRGGVFIAVAAEVRRDVLRADPQDVRAGRLARGFAGRIRRFAREGGRREEQGAGDRESPSFLRLPVGQVGPRHGREGLRGAVDEVVILAVPGLGEGVPRGARGRADAGEEVRRRRGTRPAAGSVSPAARTGTLSSVRPSFARAKAAASRSAGPPSFNIVSSRGTVSAAAGASGRMPNALRGEVADRRVLMPQRPGQRRHARRPRTAAGSARPACGRRGSDRGDRPSRRRANGPRPGPAAPHPAGRASGGTPRRGGSGANMGGAGCGRNGDGTRMMRRTVPRGKPPRASLG